MTKSDHWEKVNYHDLPQWMKRVSKPKQWVKKTYTKIFYGKPHDYQVEYKVVHGKLHISYWRSSHKPVIIDDISIYDGSRHNFSKSPSKRLTGYHYLLIILVLAGLCFVVITQFNPSTNVSSSEISTPIIADEVTKISTTPSQTQSPFIIPILIPTIDYRQSPKTISYPYIVGGSQHTISFSTYGALVDHFSKESHTYRYDPEKEVIMELLENDYQNEYLQPLIETIRKESNNPDDQAKIAVSMVQHIPYNWNKYYGTSMDWYYPYETLYNNKGVCADKSLLLAYLLNELGYDTVLFEFSGHMAVGVKCSPEYDFYDTGYAFIETTRPTIITDVPDTYYGGFSVSSNPHIIHLNGGKKVLSVSKEYRDATSMKQLEAMGQVLDQSHYAEWMRISNNYDLQYDT